VEAESARCRPARRDWPDRQAWHLNRVGHDEAACVGGHQQRAGASFAAAVDAGRAAAGEPGHVALGREQNSTDSRFARHLRDALDLLVCFPRHAVPAE
jgi:hypothetical protein